MPSGRWAPPSYVKILFAPFTLPLLLICEDPERKCPTPLVTARQTAAFDGKPLKSRPRSRLPLEPETELPYGPTQWESTRRQGSQS
jgi:hypothetical protein